MKKLFISFVFLFTFLLPSIVEAHVKWFTTLTPEKETIENIVSPLFIGMSILVAILLAAIPQLIPFIMKWGFFEKIEKRLTSFRPYSRYILKYGTAIAFIIQISQHTLFAPEFHIDNTEFFISCTMILFLLIPHHAFTKLGSILLFFLFVHMTIEQGIFHMLDYGFYLAIGFVLLIGKTKIEHTGFPFLYLGTGLSLCWVAVEKWVYPKLTLDIIQLHGVPTFGFDPSTFIILAAFIEFTVGYLLVVGILNRLLGFVVTLIFISTTLLFGSKEVIGHFMIHIVLIIFIIEGVSFYNPPIKMHSKKSDQMIFVFLNFIFVLASFLLIYYRFAV